ncbi:FdhF/YdeP family oxidoreductase [Salibacteraceae bacterium]|nr:FdhF/YdeP family oxidoreductase [Salibacteraceae bacterium]
MTKRLNDNELTPEDFTGMTLTEPKQTAAGLPAVFSAVRHIMDEMDPIRATKVMFELNQKGGVDCPGCAWPDPKDHRSKLGEYCENGAKAIAEEATTKKLGHEFFTNHSVKEMAAQSDYWIGKRGRIMHPMLLDKSATHYKPIKWDEAFQIISDDLKNLSSPNDAVFYTSGRTSNEAAFLYQLFVRMFGTNNLPDCSNMCHESSGVALSETVGIGKGSVTLDDFYESEVILVIGQNPGTNHPRMLNALKKAKKNGAKIITINPLPETGLIRFKDPQSVGDVLGQGTELTDLFLQVRINGDVALMKAILKGLLEKEKENPGKVFDHDFINSKTNGFDDFIRDLDKHDISSLSDQAGISIDQINEAVQLLSYSDKIIACWAMGLTQHENGVANIQEVVNLLLAKGSIGKPGAGTCPVRGHSNVQGDRTMGIWEKPKPEFLDALDKKFHFKVPREHGLDVVDSIKQMHAKKDMVFFALGGNFLSATPDTTYTAAALRNCKLTVHVSTKLNRSHLVTGKRAIILPSLGRSDKDIQESGKQFVTVENSMGVVHSSQGRLRPISPDLLSEPAIIAELAKATLQPSEYIDWNHIISNYDNIRDLIEAVIPGFENFNEKVKDPSGFELPNGARNGDFNSIGGKAKFTVNDVPDHQLASGEYHMTTVRTHDQFNTTIYGLNDRYRGIFNERRVVLMNKQDMQIAGLKKGDVVDLWNEHNGTKRCAPRFLVVPYSVPEKCTVTYFPETNVLVPIDSVAKKSNTPTSKMVKITIQKVAV